MNKLGAYKKKEHNIASVRARHELLVSGLSNPKSITKDDAACLLGQRNFAQYKSERRGISSIALNTLKSLSDEMYPVGDGKGKCGFAYLDSLRMQLKDVLHKTNVSESREVKRRREAEERNQLLSRLSAVERHCILQSKAYHDIYSKVNILVRDGALEEVTRLRLFNLLDVHRLAFAELFSSDIPDNRDDVSSISVLHRRS